EPSRPNIPTNFGARPDARQLRYRPESRTVDAATRGIVALPPSAPDRLVHCERLVCLRLSASPDRSPLCRRSSTVLGPFLQEEWRPRPPPYRDHRPLAHATR